MSNNRVAEWVSFVFFKEGHVFELRIDDATWLEVTDAGEQLFKDREDVIHRIPPDWIDMKIKWR